jgi:WD40 repeat protein
MKQLLWILAAPLILGAQVADVELTTPSLGYVFDGPARSLRPIEGVPGAAVLGNRVNLNAFVHHAWLSPDRRHALATSEDAGLLVLKLDGAMGWARAISAEIPLTAAFSPDGGTAAVLAGGRVQIWRGLPETPRLVSSWPAPDGALSKLVVSDDGARVAMLAGGRILIGGPQVEPLVGGDGPSDLCFLRNSHTLVAADRTGNRILIWNKAGTGSEPETLASADQGIEAPAGLAFSADESRMAVLGAAGAKVWLLNLRSGGGATLDVSGVSPEGIWRAEGNAVFQLHQVRGEQRIWLVDGDAREPRLVPVSGRGSE